MPAWEHPSGESEDCKECSCRFERVSRCLPMYRPAQNNDSRRCPKMAAARNHVTQIHSTRIDLAKIGPKFLRAIAVCAVAVASLTAQTPSISTLVHGAEAGNAKAQFELAEAYFEGNGIPKDMAKGIDWLRKSASQGYAGAQVTLGYLYQNGVQVAKDPHEAAKWYRKAARQSDKDPKHAQQAQSNLGVMATKGLIDINEADWHAPELGSEPTQQANNPPVKTPEVKNSGVKSKASPFSIAEVETGLTGGITPKRMTVLVSQFGVDFSLSASAKQRLANDGADDTLLQTIASAKR